MRKLSKTKARTLRDFALSDVVLHGKFKSLVNLSIAILERLKDFEVREVQGLYKEPQSSSSENLSTMGMFFDVLYGLHERYFSSQGR